MSPELQLFLGMTFGLLGLGYLYRPDVIERLNAVLRDWLLNDAHIALERRKWGTLLLLMSVVLIYMGWTGLLRR